MREVVANALIHADYHGRQGIVVEKRFNEIQVSNPGTMRISKEVAIEGGRSDPRNAQVFNIFSLIGIGERSGTGLSNLYALWEQHGFATPVIREEFDPEKTIVNIATESNQSFSDNTRTEPDHNPDTTRTEPDQDPSKPCLSPAQSAQGAPKVPQECPKSAPKVPQECPKSAPKTAQGAPRVPQNVGCGLNTLTAATKQVYKAMCEDITLTHRGLESKLGLSKTTIRKATATLVQKGFIRRVGPKKGGHWEIVK